MKTFNFTIDDSLVCSGCQTNRHVHYNIIGFHQGKAYADPDIAIWCNRCEAEAEMVELGCEFPYEEIRDEGGDYFDCWSDVRDAGYDDDQIWCVTCADEHNGTWITYDRVMHFINVLGYIATKERSKPGESYSEFCLLEEEVAS